MKALAVLPLILVLGTLAYPQSQSAPTRGVEVQCNDPDKSLSLIAELWKTGYNEGDASKVASLYAPDAYYLTQHFVTGIVHGRSAIQAYVQNGVDAHYHIDSIEVLKTECSGDFSYTITRYQSTNGDKKAFGLNIVVLTRIEGRWMIVAHESAVPDASTAIQHLKLNEAH